jgi:L-lactate dehydrogenase complex protein LldF
MTQTPQTFSQRAATALANPALQRALADGPQGFATGRERAQADCPEFAALRRAGRDIKDYALANLDLCLEAFERQARAAGTQVHWAATAQDANDIVLAICRTANARLVTKSKSMVSEETGLANRLQAAGLEVVETDLGEYAVQIRGETPSHIVAPAIHISQDDVAEDFRHRHAELPRERDLSTPEALVDEARGILREKFLGADIGITGANLLVADSGTAVIVTNEGNADLTLSLPRVHIVLTSIEKVVPTLNDALALLRLLARSSTGQAMTAYTTLVTGPRRGEDPDGPAECHVVLLDNGRSELLASQMREVLRCIRCGACMNHCPVYCAVGGHAYHAVYPGPIGAALMPALVPGAEARELASASTFCGRCEAVCPVEIPLVSIMRDWREMAFANATSWHERALLKAWAYVARHPRLYHPLMHGVAATLAAWAGARGRLRRVPFLSGWTRHRDLPAPQGPTFQSQWRRRQEQPR